MKRILIVALGALALAGCEDSDKKKADLLAKTAPQDAAPVVVPVVTTLPAASSVPRTVKPPKECRATAEPVIDDPEIEEAIRFRLQKPKDKSPGALKWADIAALTGLDLTRKKKPLEELDPCLFPKMTSLKSLYLGPGKVRDLSPIANLTHLESLRASINEIEDLKPLEKLVMLDRVDLGRTHVRDLGPIGNLVNLTELELDDTPVSDISPLAKCKKLEKLWLKNTTVTDVSPLKDLKNLRLLEIKGTAVNNLDTLQLLKNHGLKIVTS